MENNSTYKRLFNYRPLVSICLFFMAGIIFIVGLYSSSVIYIIFSVLSLIALLLTVVLKLIFVDENKLFKVLSVIIAFLFAMILSLIVINLEKSKYSFDGDFYVKGQICERTYRNNSKKCVVTIKNASVTDIKSLKKINIDGKIRLYLSEDDLRTTDFEIGEHIEASVELKSVSLFENGKPNFYMLNKNVRVLGFGSEEDIVSLNSYKRNIFEEFKVKVKNKLDSVLSADYSELAYTMLFGDKAGLSEEIYDNYTASGTAHLLVVSGLHIGFIVSLLVMFLGLLKANNKIKFFVISFILILYACLCGFTTSVTRAAIMSIILLYFKMRYKEYDGLSSLAFAALIILLLNPLHFYDVGFRLSFCAVAGIMIMAEPIKQFLVKYLNKKLASAISISVSTSIAITPVMCFSFSKLSIFSIVTNVIVIPIASFAYMFIFMALLISFIIPKLGIFIYIFELLMKIVTGISSLTGAMNFADANQTFILFFSIVLLLTIILNSDYIHTKTKTKLITMGVCVIICLILFMCVFIC